MTASNESDSTARRIVHYTGCVQGVGFRFTTCRVARRFRVTGYVKNLSDGRVELVAEGHPETLDRFLAGVAQALHGYIQNADITAAAATGEFDGFDTAY